MDQSTVTSKRLGDHGPEHGHVDTRSYHSVGDSAELPRCRRCDTQILDTSDGSLLPRPLLGQGPICVPAIPVLPVVGDMVDVVMTMKFFGRRQVGLSEDERG